MSNPTLTFYIGGGRDTADIRETLNDIAARLGYYAKSGKDTDEGAFAQAIPAVIAGELGLVQTPKSIPQRDLKIEEVIELEPPLPCVTVVGRDGICGEPAQYGYVALDEDAPEFVLKPMCESCAKQFARIYSDRAREEA